MSNLTAKLPDSLYGLLEEFAKAGGNSINKIMVLAAVEKVSALAAENYLKEEAEIKDRERFRRILVQVPDVERGKRDRH